MKVKFNNNQIEIIEGNEEEVYKFLEKYKVSKEDFKNFTKYQEDFTGIVEDFYDLLESYGTTLGNKKYKSYSKEDILNQVRFDIYHILDKYTIYDKGEEE